MVHLRSRPANQMLDDSIGLTEKDADGFRLRTDNGERLVLELTAIPAFIQFTQLARTGSSRLG